MNQNKGIPRSQRRGSRNTCGIYSRFKTRSPLFKKSLDSVFYSCDILEFGEGGMKLRFSEPVVTPGQILVVDVPGFSRKSVVSYPAQVCWVKSDGSGGGEAGLRFWAWG